MQTIRGRLTVAYALALAATIVMLVVVIQQLEGSATYAEFDRRVRAESDLVAGLLVEAHRARAAVVGPDLLTGRPVLVPDVAEVLERVPGYVAVLGPRRGVVFLSPDARALPIDGVERLVVTVTEALEERTDALGEVDLGAPAGRVRYYVRTVRGAGPEISLVVTGVTTETLAEIDSRVRAVADLATAAVGESRRGLDTTTTRMARGEVALASSVAQLIEAAPGIVVVVGPGRQVLSRSEASRGLPIRAVQELIDLALQSIAPGSFGLVRLGAPAGRLRYFARPIVDEGLDAPVAWVIAAAPAGAGGISRPRYVTALLSTLPFAVVVSLVIGYLLVGRTLRPVEQIVDEVEAISDGRSLHKRLGEPAGSEELTRLTSTLNAMLGRLERSFGLLRRFTADASHELKTPLTVLRSGIERSITHPQTPDDVMATLEETLFEVNRMAELVDSLLTLARADEGRAPLHFEDEDLRQILMEVQETASILGEQARVEVEVEVPPEPVRIRVDRSRMRQLLMNLLTNAIKYTPAGGNVWITTDHSEQTVQVVVRDAGIGIAPGDLPHIFDRFWRADPARSRTGARPGAGLGLAISKWIAEAHGGGIEVQSRPGRGTTFTVTIPTGLDEPPGTAGL